MPFYNHICSCCLTDEAVAALWDIMTSSGHSGKSQLLSKMALHNLRPLKGTGVTMSSFVLERGEHMFSSQ